ncbi:MAG: 4'-phosphopantetheinyl transferase superfamily protein [Methylotenera sp.]|nr:4'-phosphopantetheinyl transferase superfamily protein [Methylotenera sp.]
MQIEHLWQQILPANVCLSVCSLKDHSLPLTPAELDSIGLVGTRRLAELASGRMMAKTALASMHIDDVDIVKDKLTGAPIWPKDIVGSITHSTDLSNSHVAAVVAKKIEISSLGIDAELGGDIHHSLWEMFLSQDELSWVNSKSNAEKSLLVRKIWGLKESAIKASGQLDMLCWRVNPTISDSDSFELIFGGGEKGNSFVGKAICHNNITLAAVYSEYNSDNYLNA